MGGGGGEVGFREFRFLGLRVPASVQHHAEKIPNYRVYLGFGVDPTLNTLNALNTLNTLNTLDAYIP